MPRCDPDIAFEDNRGWIRDLVEGEKWAATEIFTKAGEIRGNHIHHETTQWVYVVSGLLIVVEQKGDESPNGAKLRPGDMMREDPGVAHAWKAMLDTVVVVFTSGPRSGSAYESDTERLEKPLI